MPLIVSTSLHALAVASILFIASLGFAVADERTEPIKEPEPMRLVFLAQPGPGGGGGGGGLKMKTPPPKAMRKGVEKISSPLPARKLPPPMRADPKPPEPPKPLEAKQVGDRADADQAGRRRRSAKACWRRRRKRIRARVRAPAAAWAPDKAPASAQGDGTGVGEGSGGGYGGGPFRPGSGVEPPRLLREVKADYTDEARRGNIEGEVELEIVVRRDGTVGDVKVHSRACAAA